MGACRRRVPQLRRSWLIHGLPLPHQLVLPALAIEGLQHQLDRHANLEAFDLHPRDHLPEHDHALALELDRRDRKRHERLRRDVRRRRLIAGVGVRPDAPGATQGQLFETLTLAERIAAESAEAREKVTAAAETARADQVRLRPERVPALEHRVLLRVAHLGMSTPAVRPPSTTNSLPVV